MLCTTLPKHHHRPAPLPRREDREMGGRVVAPHDRSPFPDPRARRGIDTVPLVMTGSDGVNIRRNIGKLSVFVDPSELANHSKPTSKPQVLGDGPVLQAFFTAHRQFWRNREHP